MNKKKVIVLPPRVPKCDFCGNRDIEISVGSWRHFKDHTKMTNLCKYCYLDRKEGKND